VLPLGKSTARYRPLTGSLLPSHRTAHACNKAAARDPMIAMHVAAHL
jgi:hypothetical protein